jgi:predicted secreted protein
MAPDPGHGREARVREFTDSAQRIAAGVGEEFALRVSSAPTTGYRWTVIEPFPDETVVRVLGDTFEPPPPRPGAVGAQFFRLGAVGPGATVVRLRYGRPWDDPSVSGEEKAFLVEVE